MYWNIHLYFLVSIIFLFSSPLKAQQLYDPSAEAQADIVAAVQEAKASNKHILLQIGGNWCGWCIRFHDFVELDSELDSLAKADYIQLRINYSHENENLPTMTQLEYPQRFGFPVFVILDTEGKRIHTQNSAYLEENKSYNKRKVKEFFQHWTYQAIHPER